MAWSRDARRRLFRILATLAALSASLLLALPAAPVSAQAAPQETAGAGNADGEPPGAARQIHGDGAATGAQDDDGGQVAALRFQWTSEAKFVLLLLVIYLVGVTFVRNVWVVRPSIARLKAERARLWADAVQYHGARIADTDGCPDPADPLGSLFASADQFIGRQPLMRAAKEKTGWDRFVEGLFPFAGNHLAAWDCLHGIQRALLDDETYAAAHARARAYSALDALQSLQDPPLSLRQELFRRVNDPLLMGGDREGGSASGAPAAQVRVRSVALAHLVKEALAHVHARRDAQFAAIVDAKNKGMLLLLLSAASVLVVVGLFPAATPLLAVGGIAGVLARLRKAIRRTRIVFDFGLNWTVMFITPVVGALTGWFGVVLLWALQELDVGGAAFGDVSFVQADMWGMIYAFVFGLSATLFDTFVDRIEREFGEDGSSEARASTEIQEMQTLAIVGEKENALREKQEVIEKKDRQLDDLQAKVRSLEAGAAPGGTGG